MRGTTRCEQDASLAIIWRALRFGRIVANADVATTTYSYDSNGNLTSGAGWGYTWDYLNRMLSAGFGNSTTTYAYDPAGNRVLQTSTTSTTFYPNKFYSFASTLIGSTTYATSTNYIWNGDTLLATIDQPMINGSATGTPITRYIHPDHLGSTNAVTDQNGALVQLLDYYPYGATRVSTSTYPTNERRDYIGQFADASGLSYLNARYYSPTQGQFLSEDPVFWSTSDPQYLLNPQMMNAYSYSADNPIVKKDPSGKLPVEAGIGALAGTIIAVGIQGAEDVHAHHLSSLSTYSADAAGGFTTGGIIGLTDGASLLAGVFLYGPTAGVAGGMVSNGVTETINSAGGGHQFNYGNLLNNAPQNAVFGMIPGLDVVPGLGFSTRGGLSTIVDTLYTKLERGTISSVSALSVLKMVLLSVLQQFPGAGAQSTYSTMTSTKSATTNSQSSSSGNGASSGSSSGQASSGSSGTYGSTGLPAAYHTACGTLCW